MTVQPYEAPERLPATIPDEQARSWVLKLRAAAEIAAYIGSTPFVPEALRDKPAEIAAAILYGAEIGLEPMQSLAKVAVIRGRPTLTAEAQRSLILAAGHELWFEESTITRAIAAGRRVGSDRVARVTWTLDDAKRAGISGGQNWQRYPAEMLRARASAALARTMFADVIGGLAAAEELEGDTDNGTTTVAVEPEKSKPAKRSRTKTAPTPPGANEPAPAPPRPQTPSGGVQAPVTPSPPLDEQPDPPHPAEPTLTKAQSRQIFALMRDVGIEDRGDRLAFTTNVIGGRKIDSSNDLTVSEAGKVIEALTRRLEQTAPAEPEQEQATVTALENMVGDRLDQLVTEALERPDFSIRDLYIQVATYRHELAGALIDDLQGRAPTGRLLWEPLKASLKPEEAADLTSYLAKLTARPADDIPY